MVNEKHEVVWNNCLNIIGSIIQENIFTTWFKPIIPVRLKNNVLTIEVPSSFFREYLEEHFIDLLGKSLRRELGAQAKLEYNVKISSSGPTITIPQQSTQPYKNHSMPFVPSSEVCIANPFIIPGIQQLQIDPQLNPSYTFDNFIEGNCNRLARSAGLSIASNPGKTTFNPLFLYGGSGLGKTSARGQKGQKSRSGGGKRPGFEGGQMPLVRRLPKRGFTNIFRTEYAIVNIGSLNVFEAGAEISSVDLFANGLIGSLNLPVKVLGNGELSAKLTVKAAKFTKSAQEKIEAAGGKAEVV